MNRSRVFVVSGSRVVGHGRNMLRLAVFVGCHFHDYVAKKRGTYVRKRVKCYICFVHLPKKHFLTIHISCITLHIYSPS